MFLIDNAETKDGLVYSLTMILSDRLALAEGGWPAWSKGLKEGRARQVLEAVGAARVETQPVCISEAVAGCVDDMVVFQDEAGRRCALDMLTWCLLYGMGLDVMLSDYGDSSFAILKGGQVVGAVAGWDNWNDPKWYVQIWSVD